MEISKTNQLKRGVLVFAVLAILTAVEYLIGTNQVSVILLWLIALVKAGTVIWFFMHVFRLFGSEGDH
jgi:cytochrome c oxidase subunit IV